jgi:hypothetical protein
MTLRNEERTVLVCTACGFVICPYCYIDEDGDLVGAAECQGHVENLTDDCDHGDEDEE